MPRPKWRRIGLSLIAFGETAKERLEWRSQNNSVPSIAGMRSAPRELPTSVPCAKAACHPPNFAPPMVFSPRSTFRHPRSAAEGYLTADPAAPLERAAVIQLASVLGLDDRAFVIGGQALNLWAERYARTLPELAQFGPFTSKDIDYYGHRAAAEKLARALGGEVLVPEAGDHTPNQAVVVAEIGGRKVAVDFLAHVIGVQAPQLEKAAVEIVVPIKQAGFADELVIPIMHPLHCLQSRVANVITLGRTDPVAMRQLAAAPHVLRAYIEESLESGEAAEARAVLKALYRYLTSDVTGRACRKLPMIDPATIITGFIDDTRLDWRFRWFNLRSMRRKLHRKSIDA